LSAGRKQRGEPVSCFPAGTKVLTSTGSKNIEDIEIGDKVLTHTGKYKEVEGVNKRIAKEKLHLIKAVGHPEFYCTPEHPILIWSSNENEKRKSIIDGDGSNGNLLWVAAKDVNRETDYVVSTGSMDQRQARTYNIFELFLEKKKLSNSSDFAEDYDIVDGRIRLKLRDKKTIKKNGTIYNSSVLSPYVHVTENYDFGLWVGYFLSQGYVMKRQCKINGDKSENYTGVSFTFNSKHDFFIKEILELTKKIFGIEATINVNDNDGSTKVNVNNIFVGHFIETLFGTGFDKKRVTNEMMTAPDDFLAGIVTGIFRGDGCVASSYVTLALTNPELIYDIRNACLKLGLIPNTRFYNSASPGKINGEIRISGNTINNENFIYEMKRDLHKYNGYSNNSWFGNNRMSNGEIGNYKTYKVLYNLVSKEDYNDYVYNLHVKDDHTYQVNGVIVHNCFLINVPDDMESIARSIGSALQLSKRGGGVALCLTDVREAGAPIKGIDGAAAGLVPVMKLYEDSFSYADQLG
jgi:ribonucleoside-diphosphate reductase alpha chain